MGVRRPLWLASAAGRPFAAAGVALVAALTVMTAVLGPLLLRAVEQSTLRAEVASAGAATDVVVQGYSASSSGRPHLVDSIGSIASAARDSGAYDPPVIILRSADALSWQASPGARSGNNNLVARSDGCEAFTMVRGRCPAAAGEIAVPAVLLGGQGLRVGDPITVAGRDSLRFTIVGGYQGGGSDADLLVASPVMVALPLPVAVSGRDVVDRARLSLDRIPELRAGASEVQRALLAAQSGAISFSSDLSDVLAQVTANRQAAAALVFVVTAQGVVLGLLSAVAVMAVLARARAPEWAQSRFRGVRRRAWLGVVFAEPAILVGLGAVLGAALGWLVGRIAAGRVAPAGTPVEFWRVPVLIACCIAVGGLVVAAALASVRGAREPLATLLREAADRPRVSRLAIAGETLVVAVAIAAVYQLRAGTTLIGTAGALALLAPGLLATALGLLAIRIGAAAVKRRSAGPPRTLAGLLVVRQFARVPSLLQRQIAVAIGAALLVFGTQVAALAARNQRLHADAIAGAATVLHVQVPPGMSLETAVRAADPLGTQAMAVEELPPSSGAGTSRVIAVDISRIARVAVWHQQWAHMSASRLAALLRPAVPGPVVLRGNEVGVSLANAMVATNTEDSIGSDVGPNPGPPRADLVLVVAALDGASPWQQITLGRLHSGEQTFHGNIACRTGCRLVQLQVLQESQTPFNVHFTIAALHTSQQEPSAFTAALRDAARWRPVLGTPDPGQPAQSTVSTTAQGLRVSMTTLPGDATSPAVAPANTPDPLPALLAAGTTAPAIAGYPGTTPGVGLDGQQMLLRIVGRADVLPRSLNDGALIDLDTAAALADPGHDQAIPEVWLAPGAHPGVERALAREGVQILGRERIATIRAALGEAAPARAIRAGLAIAGAAALLAMFVLVVTRVIDAERRQRLWTVGRLSGFSQARLARVVTLEVGAPAVVATLIGALAGLLTVWLAGERLPLFAAGTVGPPLDMTANWAVAGLTVAATLVVVVGVSLAVAATEARHKSPLGERP